MNLQSVLKTYFTHTIGQQQRNERNLNNKNELCDLITALELKVNSRRTAMHEGRTLTSLKYHVVSGIQQLFFNFIKLTLVFIFI